MTVAAQRCLTPATRADPACTACANVPSTSPPARCMVRNVYNRDFDLGALLKHEELGSQLRAQLLVLNQRAGPPG
jgi:hypothetical protein